MEIKGLTKEEMKRRIKTLKKLERKEHNPYREKHIKLYKKELRK